MTENYAVIGCPIGHTMSPFIHKRLFALSLRPADYTAIEISPEELAGRVAGLFALSGFNVTVPHKRSIIPYLDSLDSRASLYGAVNTVSCGGKNIGYNTDGYGFLAALKLSQIELCGSILLCGAGGAARMMAFEAALAGCRLTLAVREDDIPAATLLAGEIRGKVPNAGVRIVTLGGLGADSGHYELLANATPLGMYPEINGCAVGPETVDRCDAVFDAVYNPRETVLLKTAGKLGKKCAGGLPMLVWQAARAHEIWYGASFAADDLLPVTRDTELELDRVFRRGRDTE